MRAKVQPAFWSGKKVFVTGHTGFKGSWLAFWLTEMGAEVTGYALAPSTNPSLFQALKLEERLRASHLKDIVDIEELKRCLDGSGAEIVFHLAAQPLVRESYRDPVRNFASNVMGTVNILEAARSIPSVRTIVNVTTDKVYENPETQKPFSEGEPLGGHDPYSASKACSEIVTSSYRRSFLGEKGIGVATARAGNVIGGGDWSVDRLMPDMVHTFLRGEDLAIRYPRAVRPWQHVLEPISGYLILAERLWSDPKAYSEAFNFGPSDEDCLEVQDMVRRVIALWGQGTRLSTQEAVFHEAGLLKLNSAKAKRCLGWEPLWPVDTALEKTVAWYKAFHGGQDARELTRRQLHEFTTKEP